MTQETRKSPCKTAYFIARSLARFFGSIYFPFFRFWGETEFKPAKKRVFIVRNFGLLTWISALRIFRQPLSFIVADQSDSSLWFKLAVNGGLSPVRLTFDLNEDLQIIEALCSRENCLLLIASAPDSFAEKLVRQLKCSKGIETLFMAISGANVAFPPGTIVPKVCPVSVFCGLPHLPVEVPGEVFAELRFLERAMQNIPLGELPSIFSNHQRNLENPTS